MNHFEWREYLTMRLFNVNWGLCLACLFFYGCANTATVKESLGTTLEFSITFNATPSFSTHSYYIIYSDSPLSMNTNTNSNYFFLPGETYNEVIVDNNNGLSSYYNTYYSTWDGAIQLFSTPHVISINFYTCLNSSAIIVISSPLK